MGISSVPNLGEAFLPLALLPLLLLKDGLSWAILHVIGSNGTGSHDDTVEVEAAAAGLRVMPAEWIRRQRRQQGGKEWCCSVCLQGFEEEVSQIVACGHLFHQSCLRRWLLVGVGNTCPLCRSTLG